MADDSVNKDSVIKNVAPKRPNEYQVALELFANPDRLKAPIAKPFEGKRVLVTGGGKGIGKDISLAFALRGASVAIGCNANPGMAEATLAQVRSLSSGVLICSDIGTPDGADYLVDETVRQLGGLDILVSNAAMQYNESLLETNIDTFVKTLNVNARAPFLLMKRAHPYLKASGAGRVILISSVHGKRATDFDAGYAVSKGALGMLCREAAIEFARDGITVNIIAPGGVVIEGKTGAPKTFSMLRLERARYLSKYPLGRIGVPRDTAEAACFLASEEAEHITGTTLRLDGGTVLL
ncbi:glucose 1-dehydrogenase [Clostridia bacterium]|nr:glucose 1-dehydrogenase [Clostridia bacterium]